MRRIVAIKTYVEVFDVQDDCDIMNITQTSEGKIKTLQSVQIVKDTFITPYVQELDLFEDEYFWDIDNGISD